MMKNTYILVEASILPKVFEGVLCAKKLIAQGNTTINKAAEQSGISRSAYYKYKDYVFSFSEMSDGGIITLFFVLKDKPGVLSDILGTLAKSGANILTINQNIPVNGSANITISFQATGGMNTDELLEQIKRIFGVNKVEIIARG